MRPERLYLQDIVDAADAVARFVAGMTRDDFLASELHQSAVIHQLAVMGEAAAHIERATRATAQEVPWSRVVAFRNFAIHAYFSVQQEIVWDAATLNAPALRHQVAAVLRTLDG